MNNSRFKCSLKFCDKHMRCKNKEIHHFTLNELSHEDLHFEKEVLEKKLPSYLKSSLEPEELKNIYQSAYIFQLLFSFAQEYLPEVESQKNTRKQQASENISNTKEASTDTNNDKIKDKIVEFLFKNENKITNEQEEKNKISTTVEAKKTQIEEQLWNTDDINILRKTFASIKETNIQLKSRLLVLENENKELKERYEALENETKNLPAEKRALSAENERLYIRVVDLEREYKTFNNQIDACDNEIKSLKEKLDCEKKLNQTISNEKIRTEFELRKCENDLITIKNEFKLKQTLLIEKIKLKYQNKINKLENKIKSLENDLNIEKEEHLKSQNALKHLRSHFLTECLPVQQKPVKLADNQIKMF